MQGMMQMKQAEELLRDGERLDDLQIGGGGYFSDIRTD